MSAFAYIDMADVPLELRETSVARIDEITGETLVAFDGCPLVGTRGTTVLWIKHGVEHVALEYPFPRSPELRNSLVAWLMFHGIHFRVVM